MLLNRVRFSPEIIKMNDPALQMANVVGLNLKRLREERSLSLDRLAEQTGVSRSMLNQIERGSSSPTIATLYKITTSLKISLTELTTLARSQAQVVRQAALEPIREDEGHFRAYALQPFTDGNNFEIFLCEQDAGSSHRAEPHQPGSEEFITVFSGELTLTVSGADYRLKSGDFIRFKADTPHAYANNGQEMLVFNLLNHYKR